jgi:glyoxylate/hydroxypyruvate reductase A
MILISPGNMAAAPWVEAFAAALPGRPVAVAGRDPYDPSAVRYAVVWKPPHGLLATLPALEAIFSIGAGVDHIVADPSLPAVPLARVVDPDLTARMTEWVVWQVLAHHRRQREYADLQARRLWKDLDQPIAGEVRVGMMGLGVLGRDAAEVLVRLGFDVGGWSRTPQAVAGVETFAGAEGFAPFLARTDILVCLLPLTPETRGVLDARLIAGLARDGVLGGPVLINAGRGGLQVEADILAALDAGVLAAASLDVFETEPLPPSSRLWTHRRVTITPHVAAVSHPPAIARLIGRQILRHEAGEPLEHLVDTARGY